MVNKKVRVQVRLENRNEKGTGGLGKSIIVQRLGQVLGVASKKLKKLATNKDTNKGFPKYVKEALNKLRRVLKKITKEKRSLERMKRKPKFNPSFGKRS
jgi:hypothetical protein